MKKLLVFIILSIIAFAGSFAAARAQKLNTPFTRKEDSLRPAFVPTQFAVKNHPFTIVIVGFNNGATVEKTLASVFSQSYDNYRVIYIDDASDNGSFALASDLIYSSDQLSKVTIVQNEVKLGLLANLSRAVETCSNEEIVIVLQGDDWLSHEWVLQRLNAYYADPDLWITYGQYRDFPNFQLGPIREISESDIRRSFSAPAHLKTFYAALFKKIDKSDFVCQGKFLTAGSECAFMIPMLEMALGHSQFISEVLYISNRQSEYKNDLDQQVRSEKWVRNLMPYSPLLKLEGIQ